MTRRLLLDRRGASAAEFALVAPLLILFIFGIIDGGRFLWEVNKAEKATQVGARVAIVTDVLDSGIEDENYVGVVVDGVTLTQGDVIPAGAFATVSCTSGGCDGGGTFDTASFDRIVERMSFMKPDIDAADVTVTYRGSGLGFAGDPNGMDVAPLVTVELQNVQFRPLVLLGAVPFTLPPFTTTLTAEDSDGVQSN
jgi:Flp pilus assembly protein TadG